MIHLTPEGAAVACASLLVIVVFIAAKHRAARNARIMAKYRRGEQDREVQLRKADILEPINCDVRRLS